ncbi:MAG TPA: ATP synthase F0 subunit B [Polyangiaceae bacterium]|jgi:F-type H+-transporting ATPase subunit b
MRAWVSRAAIELDLDKTVIIQAVLFALLVVILKPLLFDPVLAVFGLREERTEGAKVEARRLQGQAGELLVRYERERQQVHQVAANERDRTRTETARLEASILGEARAAVQDIVERGRKNAGEQVNSVRFQLGRESERIARDVAARVLGREVG